MGLVVAASVIAFITTQMDDMLIMFVQFSKAFSFRQKVSVLTGKFAVLFFFIAAYRRFDNLSFFLPAHSVGFLGFVPVVVGILYALKWFKVPPGKECVGKNFFGKFFICLGVFAETSIVSFADSVNNVDVYTSFFNSLGKGQFALSCIVFFVMQSFWCLIALCVMNAKSIRDYIKMSRRVIIPVLYILLGIYILLINGTIPWILGR